VAGYPVYVDPLRPVTGARLGNAPGPAGATLGIRRIIPAFAGGNNRALSMWFSLPDDLTFFKDGPNLARPGVPPVGPYGTGAGGLFRQGRYSWAYLLRPQRSTYASPVDLTIVVYQGRSSGIPSGEGVYTAGTAANGGIQLTPGSNLVEIAPLPGQEAPAIKPGNWILDATVINRTGPGAAGINPDPHGFFYRVVGVNQAGIVTQLELQTPLKGAGGTYPGVGAYPIGATNQGVIVVFDNIAEVFEKGTAWQLD
jgi:hypothetical protein